MLFAGCSEIHCPGATQLPPPPLSTGLHPAALTALLGDGRLDGDTALKERRVLLQGLHEVAVVAGEGDGP